MTYIMLVKITVTELNLKTNLIVTTCTKSTKLVTKLYILAIILVTLYLESSLTSFSIFLGPAMDAHGPGAPPHVHGHQVVAQQEVQGRTDHRQEGRRQAGVDRVGQDRTLLHVQLVRGGPEAVLC